MNHSTQPVHHLSAVGSLLEHHHHRVIASYGTQYLFDVCIVYVIGHVRGMAWWSKCHGDVAAEGHPCHPQSVEGIHGDMRIAHHTVSLFRGHQIHVASLGVEPLDDVQLTQVAHESSLTRGVARDGFAYSF